MRNICFLMLLAALTWCGCGKPSQSPAPQSQKATPAASTKHGGRDNVKVVDAGGHLIWRLKADKKGYRIYNKDDELVVRLKTAQDHIKAEDEGKTFFKLKRRGKKYKTWVAEDDAKVVLFTYSENDDGGYELGNSYGELLYTVRREKYGYAVINGKNQVVCKMKVEEDGVIAESPDGTTLMEMRGSSSAVAASALALDSFDMPRRAGLFAFLHQLEAGDIAAGM